MNNEEQLALQQEQIVVESEEISLPIEDSELIRLINRKITETTKKKKELDLPARVKQNWRYFKGKHIDEENIDSWQLPFVDNSIYDNTNYRIVMAASRIPDISLLSPGEDIQSRNNADELKLIVESKIKTRAVKSMIKKGLLHLHTDFIGAIKCRWDKNKTDSGDFIFEIVRPSDIDIDMTATIPDDGFTSDNMEVIVEWLNEPTKVIMAKYPGKKDEFMKEIGVSDPNLLPAKIRYCEAHFTYYMDNGDQIEGVAWKYKNCILGKTRTPNYDWKGYMGASDKPALDENNQPLVHPMTGEPIYQQEQLFHNFFEKPRKPYIFFSYLNDNDSPTEVSTPIEQSISLQRNINRRGRQVTEISDNVVPKLAFNGKYITKEEVRNITKDPNEHIYIPNDDEANDTPIGNMVTQFTAAPPPTALLEDMQINRSRMAQKFNTSNANQRMGAMRESGISKQITKEVDLAVSDDIIEIVVERVIFEMTSWAIQMMKLNYDEEHYVRTLGPDGKAAFISMSRDKIEDGIVVEVEVSATKKAERQSTAQFLSQSGAIDPFSLLEDMGVPNEKVRLQRLLSFQLGKADGYKEYLTELGINPMSIPQLPPMAQGPGQEGGGQPDTGSEPPQESTPGAPEPSAMDAQQAQKDIEMLIQGQSPEPSAPPTEEYVKVFADFAQSQPFASLPPEAQQHIKEYMVHLKSLLQPQPAVT